MKKYYPIMLDIKGKRCISIGGGKIAQRKVKSLLEYGAEVTVISPEITDELEKMVKEGLITLKKRRYQKGDLKGSFLVYVATGVPLVNEACRKEGDELGILINVVDVPKLCNFIVPAVHRQGGLTLTVSTDGKSPMFSKKIKEELEKSYGPQYQIAVDIMGEIRERALVEINDINVRNDLFHKLVYSNVADEINNTTNLKEKLWQTYQIYKDREGCE